MYPQWHVFWAYAIFRKKRYALLATLFAFLPDAPLITALLLGIETALTSEFNNQTVKLLAMMAHSFVSIAVVGVLLLLFARKWLPLVYGWAFHTITDLFTHGKDAIPLFWPLSIPAYHGPISYFETDRHSSAFTIVNVLLFLLVSLLIYRKKSHQGLQLNDLLVIAIVLLGQIAQIIWLVAFDNLTSFDLAFAVIPGIVMIGIIGLQWWRLRQ